MPYEFVAARELRQDAIQGLLGRLESRTILPPRKTRHQWNFAARKVLTTLQRLYRMQSCTITGRANALRNTTRRNVVSTDSFPVGAASTFVQVWHTLVDGCRCRVWELRPETIFSGVPGLKQGPVAGRLLTPLELFLMLSLAGSVQPQLYDAPDPDRWLPRESGRHGCIWRSGKSG